MNATAKGLGALDTTVQNPSGLDAPGQYTSAYDLALFARAGLARQDFRDYDTTVKTAFPGKMPKKGKTRKSFQIYTQDRLLLNYPGAIGVKTGWTTKARGTFVGAATRGGHTLVATVMHTKFSSWEESRALLEWGFANIAKARPVGSLNQVKHLTQASSVRPSGPGRNASARSAPSCCWTRIEISGVSTRREPSRCEAKVTPFSSIFASRVFTGRAGAWAAPGNIFAILPTPCSSAKPRLNAW